MNEFVDVAIPVGVRKTFAYSVPPEFRERIAAGMRVLVPFGRKLVTGYVTGILNQGQIGDFKLRAVRELLEPESTVPASLAETALWIARYYFAPPGEVFRALFPAGTQVSGERRVSLTPRAATLLSGGLRPPGLKPQEDALLEGRVGRKFSIGFEDIAGRLAKPVCQKPRSFKRGGICIDSCLRSYNKCTGTKFHFLRQWNKGRTVGNSGKSRSSCRYYAEDNFCN